MRPVYETTGQDRRRHHEERSASSAQNGLQPIMPENLLCCQTMSDDSTSFQPQHIDMVGPVDSSRAFSPCVMSTPTHRSLLSLDLDNYEQAASNPFTGTSGVSNEESRSSSRRSNNPFLWEDMNQLEFDSAYRSTSRVSSPRRQPLLAPEGGIPQGLLSVEPDLSELLSDLSSQPMQCAHAQSSGAPSTTLRSLSLRPPPPPYSAQAHEMRKSDRIVVTELMKRVQNTDGSDAFAVYQFLKAVKPIFDFVPGFELEVIKLLTPKVTGRLLDVWIRFVSDGRSWDELHVEILDIFISELRRRELEKSELDRPMRREETFIDYCENVIAAAYALVSRLSNQEVIEIILSKCRPHVKTHFVFSTAPQTVEDLMSLAYKVTNAVRAESRYFGNETSVNMFNVQAASRPVIGWNIAGSYPQPINNVYDNRPVNTIRIVACHKCNNEGHTAPDCRM